MCIIIQIGKGCLKVLKLWDYQYRLVADSGFNNVSRGGREDLSLESKKATNCGRQEKRIVIELSLSLETTPILDTDWWPNNKGPLP